MTKLEPEWLVVSFRFYCIAHAPYNKIHTCFILKSDCNKANCPLSIENNSLSEIQKTIENY